MVECFQGSYSPLDLSFLLSRSYASFTMIGSIFEKASVGSQLNNFLSQLSRFATLCTYSVVYDALTGLLQTRDIRIDISVLGFGSTHLTVFCLRCRA